MNELTQKEMHALRYYEGIPDCLDKGDPFWSDQKAYVTFNSLFFDGIETETARSQENRKLNPAIALERDKALALTASLLSCCQKYEHGAIRCSRVERLIDYQKFRTAGMFTSFISTSRNGYLRSYQDKHDLVLMDIEIAAKAPCCDLIAMMPRNEKSAEGEVLIAPYTEIEVHEGPVPQDLQKIVDGNGRSPAVYCHVKVGSYSHRDGTAAEKISSAQKEAVRNLYHALNMHAVPKEEDIALYLSSKKSFQTDVFSLLQKIQRNL
ncbi:MAG: hypothetical protein GX478_04240 [Erysipelotrichaceae bacterium]|jgi:hypothetical protein|nr:hypothetical protein [Erysipelotrichaceae bacterium]